MTIAVIALILANTSPSGAASAQGVQNVSSYTSTAEKDCRKISEGETADDAGPSFVAGLPDWLSS